MPGEPGTAPPPPIAVQDRMKRDWDRRAEENARFYIASGAAETDEEFLSSGRSELEEAVLDGIELSPEAEALEIGCGVGRLLIPLSRKVRTAHGVDISEVMIQKSAQYCADFPNVKTRVTDGTLRGFADASLDFVFSFIVFQHIPEVGPIRAYVEEAGRVLKPGGLFRFQVDGRWKNERDPEATYDGVKFSPAQVRGLLAGTPLDLLEEWGAETHYHWVTARRRGAPAAVRAAFSRREFDPVVLEHTLRACGAEDAAAATLRVMDGSESLRQAVAPLEARLHGLEVEELVREAYRSLLGAEPPEAQLRHHVHILSAGIEAREDLLDILLFSSELRELVRPFMSEPPWYRLESIREKTPSVPGDVTFFDAVDAVTRYLRGCAADRTVRLAFDLVLGRRPDTEGARFYERLFASHPLGARLVARHLLGSPEAQTHPGPLPRSQRSALAGRARVDLPETAPVSGESFGGEAALARRLLTKSIWMGARDFVRFAYEKVLGREVDQEGASFYGEKLERGEFSRTEVLRQLLRSPELREG